MPLFIWLIGFLPFSNCQKPDYNMMQHFSQKNSPILKPVINGYDRGNNTWFKLII